MKGEETMARTRTPARAAANKRYDDKTYKTIGIKLRFDEDADLIESFEKAHAEGKTSREWIRGLCDGYKRMEK